MDILLIFNEKPRNVSKEQAIKLANEGEVILEKERYKVIFHEIDALFNQLFSICGKWSTTQLFIDNKEYEVSTVFAVMNNCYWRSRCTGICYLINRTSICDYNNLFGLIGLVTEPGIGSHHHIEQFKDTVIGLNFIKKINENTYSLDKGVLKNTMYKDYEVPFKFCPSISEEKIIHKINSLPEKIIIQERNRKEIHSDFTDYEEMAEIMAPIFAREIKKILIEIINEIHDDSNKEQ